MSVLELLNQLCVKVFDSEFTTGWHPDLPKLRRKALKTLRTKCYEILLHKVSITESHYESDWSPAAQVIGHIITLREQQMYHDAKKMEECALKMLDTNLHHDPVMNGALELLLRLQDSVPRREDYEPVLFRYERPKPYNPAQGVVPYEILHPSAFQPPPWMLHLARPSPPSRPGFFPPSGTFPFTSEPGQDLPVLGRFLQPARIDGVGSKVALYTFPQFKVLTEPRGLQVPQLLHEKPLADEGYVTPSNEASRNVSPCERVPSENHVMTVDEIWEAAMTFNPPALRTWEMLGKRIVPNERPFLTEAGEVAAKHFIQVSEDVPGSVNVVATPQVISMEQLLQDAGYLLLGVQTKTFPFSEEHFTFHLASGVCVDGLSVSTLSKFCVELLELGTCSRRLQILSQKGVPGHPRSQLMEALREHVGTYLQFYWGATLLMPPCTSLVSLHHWTHSLHRKTVALARLCGVAPSGAAWTGQRRIPSGMVFVSYIYEILSEETRPDVCCILYSTLQAVLRAYFRFLERWIFEGSLFDPWEEFFVQAMPSRHPLSRRDRKDWSQAYRVVRDTVPMFLRGLEDDILLCGKTVHLLKLCCPKAALCVALESGNPPVPCCLRRRELQRLSNMCHRFQRRVQSLEGSKLDSSSDAISSWRQQGPTEAEIQKQQETIQQARERHMLRFKLEQEAGRQAIVQKQLQWRAELQQQTQEIQQRREEEQRRERQQELEILQADQLHKQEYDRRKEEEKQRMIEYYEELSEIATKRKELANWRIERMNLRDRREEFILNDRRQWRMAASELNQKNTEHSVAKGPLTIIEEDSDAAAAKAENMNEYVAATLTLPLTNTTREDGDNTIQSMDNVTTNQESPNNNNVDNVADRGDVNENVKGCVLDIHESSFVGGQRNLLDTTIEDVALGNVLIPLSNQNRDTANEIATAVDDNTIITATVVKEKVREQEFDIFPNQNKEVQRQQRETERSRVMSAAERNRQKVMEQEYGITQPQIERPKSVPLRHTKESVNDYKNFTAESRRQNFEDTTAQRRTNRWNMLHGQTNLITGALNPMPPVLSTIEHSQLEADSMTVRETPSDDGIHVVFPSPASTDPPMSKSDSSSSVNHVFKTASAQSSKTSSSYNIASIASSTSFDLGSGKFSLNTPTSTDDGSIFTFKTCTGSGGTYSSDNSHRLHQGDELKNTSIPYWKSTRLVTDEEDRAVVEDAQSPENTDDETEDSSDASDIVDYTDFTSINVALQKSVAIPLYTQLRLANETVLKFFFQELNIFSHFLCLRSLFFLMDGEYSRTMTNSLFHKIATVGQPSHLLNYVVLNALLRKALDASLSGSEENARRLSFKVSSTPDHFHLRSAEVLECLSLRYRTEWPLNIIITDPSLSKYNHIFIFLLKVRLVSWRLEDGFRRLKLAGGKDFGRGSKQYHCVQLWRHEMMHFVRSVQNYIMATALQSSWENFEQELNRVQTLDDLYLTHVSYVKHILYRCFLYKNSHSLHSALMKVFDTILKFHVQLEASQWCQRDSESPAVEHPGFQTLTKIHDVFQVSAVLLYKFVDKLIHAGYQKHLCELLEILNANGYYTRAASG